MRSKLATILSVTLLVYIAPVLCARILGVVPTASYSHQVAFYPLWRELSLRGHQVTVITTNPINDSSLTNLTEIDLSHMYELQADMDVNKLSELSITEMFEFMRKMGYELIDEELKHPRIKKLLEDKDEHFDVVLVETIFPGMVAFAERFKCPLIQIFSVDAQSPAYYSIGQPIHPVLNPDLYLPFSGKLNFFERLISVFTMSATIYFFQYVIAPTQNEVMRKHFGNQTSSLEEILANTSLMFVNSDFVFHPLRPLLPNVIQIGGGTHVKSKPSVPLPKDLQRILDDAKNGVIYFSLGSNVKSRLLPENVRKIILETFAELPYTILWKFELDNLPGKPNNVHISKWFPQQEIFKHPNVKVFVSQGGLQSMDEAVHNHIPIIGIPFFGDQGNNVKRIETMGMGLGLDVKTINKPTLKNAILEVMNNPKYRNRVKELAELADDQPMTGLERGIWWTEYVIRHKGAKHLKSPVLELPSYQYFLLDVIGFVLFVIFIVLYILVKLVKLVFKFVRYLLPKSKVKTQ